MPSVPPYSSTTIARCWFSRRISLSAVRTPAVPGSRLTSRARSPTVAARPAGWLGRNRSRTCTNPTTSSSSRPATGKRDQLESATCLAARLAVIDASRKATSVRGVITSRTSRSPARNTSSISRRSSLVSDSCAATRSRSSSWVIASPLDLRVPADEADEAVGRRGEQPDDRPGQGGRPVERGSDEHRQTLGALQRQSFRGQLAQDEGQIADARGDDDEGQRSGQAGAHPPARPAPRRTACSASRRRTPTPRAWPG